MGKRLRKEAWVIIEEGALPSHVGLAMMAIADMTSDSGQHLYASVDTLATRICKSRNQARSDLRKLAELGAIQKVAEGGGRSNTSVYFVSPMAALDTPAPAIAMSPVGLPSTGAFWAHKRSTSAMQTLQSDGPNSPADWRGTGTTVENQRVGVSYEAQEGSCLHTTVAEIDACTRICAACKEELPARDLAPVPKGVVGFQ